MMLYIAGIFTGLLIATIVFICEILLSKRQSSITKAFEQGTIVNYLTSRTLPKGSIYIPKDDADEARQEIIKNNDKAGKPTKLSDLYDEN